MVYSQPNFLCFLLLPLLPLSITAQTQTNRTLGSSLSAADDSSSWASPSGDFAFGFRRIGTSGFLLAIWFDKIPEKTITWSANRNNPVQRRSQILLTTDGRFVLNDPRGQEVWSANPSSTGVAYGAMLDSGNFVLASNDSITLWESFDEPTDTILPTQVLGLGVRLVASFLETDFSSGRFGFALQANGNLELYTTNFPQDTVNRAYWSSQTEGSGFQVVFNQSGFVYLRARNGSILDQVLSNSASTSQFYQRTVLEYDGVLRQYLYPKSAGATGGRPMAWSTLSFHPQDVCMSIRQDTGSGACGFNSYCRMRDGQRPRCECPSGYTIMDPDDPLSGCRPNFVPQNCAAADDDQESKETERFGFVDLANVDWPLSDYEHFQSETEDWCREACLSDCFCAVAIFRNGDCWKKKNPLSNGRVDPTVGGKALIKIRRANSTAGSGLEGSRGKDQSTLVIILSVLLGGSVLFNLLVLVATLLVMVRFNKNRKTKMLQPHSVVPGLNLRNFAYNELEEATNEFKDEIGRGASGTVYRGVLKYENGNVVAVKKLDIMVSGESEFKAEMSTISRTNHKNLVQLIGYCNDGEHQLLVYEFMSNGSLASSLFEGSKLNWYKRIQVAFGTARGLCYLHEECSTQIIHCDIKPQNVLLDDTLTARISDFGLAKLLRTDQSRTTTAIRGTRGYVAPEWFKNMPITVKVDVYSFGILLLELVCCRRSLEQDLPCENERILADWAYDCYKEGKFEILVKNDEEAMDDLKRVEKFVMVAIWCIQDDQSLRPTMKKVTQMLEGAVEVSVPPDPCSFISSV